MASRPSSAVYGNYPNELEKHVPTLTIYQYRCIMFDIITRVRDYITTKFVLG